MCNVKGSAALVIAAAAMIMFLTGCETTKHAEVMTAEELAAQAQASGSQGSATGSGSDQGGIPLAGQGMSEGSLSVGDSSGTVAGTGSSELSLSSINPEGPPSPTLRDVSGASMGGDISGGSTIADTRGSDTRISDGMEGGTDSGTHVPTGESMGPSGYEGQQFVRALIPSDFVPESPPQPMLGDGSPSTDSGMGTSGTSGSGDEVVRLPDLDSIEPLSQGDLDGSQEDGSNGIGGGGGLGHVYFDFDQYLIRDDAVSTLQGNAQLLSATYQNSSVLIEGHCDERGTTDYNLVLGERRAQAVKDYLVNLGVSSSRIQIVSYGKERPSCIGSEESCYQENRRGHVVLQ